MSRRAPAPPHGGTSLCLPLTTTAPPKNEGETFTTTSFTGKLTQCARFVQRTQIIDHSTSLTHHSLKISIYYALQTALIRR